MNELRNEADEMPKYVRLIDEMAKETDDKISLRYEVLSVFSPAHDTVAVILGNLFFHLARHPLAWSKLRDEIMPTINQPLTYILLKSYKRFSWAIRDSKYIAVNTL